MRVSLYITLLVILCGCSGVDILPTSSGYDYTSVMESVYSEIEYVSESNGGVTDDWQTPKETEELGTGDCEDFCILMLKRVYDLYGVKGYLGLIEHVDPDISAHALVMLDVYYDPTINYALHKLPHGWRLTYAVEYDNVMFQAVIKGVEIQ